MFLDLERGTSWKREKETRKNKIKKKQSSILS
jgi:hypothetical protein